ncbi:TniQ family protein [Streptomyces hirsutus]|uniref:TniQ family protein n=1 Tax=Streptomyces hirsutus TaxID=35620 RepID=UPI003325E145
MTWATDRLPIVLPPLPGEALDSWIEAYACRLRTSSTGLLRFLGLPGIAARHLVFRLEEADLKALARLTDADASELDRMTLRSVARSDLLPQLPQNGDETAPVWRHLGRHSRFCPRCLADNGGRWPLAWRLPFSFACQQHQCLLVDHCPGCRDRPQLFTNQQLGRSTSGAHCMRLILRDGRKTACRHDLTQTPAQPLPPDGTALASQQHIDALVQARSPALHHLYFLSRRCLRSLMLSPWAAPEAVGLALRECNGGLLPDSPHDLADASRLAIGTTLAIWASDTASTTGKAVFEWLIRTDQAHRRNVSAANLSIDQRLLSWGRASPEMVSRVIADADQDLPLDTRLRYRSAAHPRRPDLTDADIRKRADKIPTALWPSWTLRLLPNTPIDPRTVDGFRRGCRSKLLLAGAKSQHHPWAQPSNRLIIKMAFRRVIASPEHETAIASCLTQLASHLDDEGSPIDYGRRRRLFTSESITLNLDEYTQLCRRQGWARGGTGRIHMLRWMLLSFLLGTHADLPPRNIHARDEFRYQAPPLMRAFLLKQAATNLAAHRIDEPVLWEPPTEWCDRTDWPGATPEQIADSDFDTLIADRTPADETAAALGLTAEHVRLYCDATGTTQPPPPPASPGLGRRRPRRGMLDPGFLRTAHSGGALNQSLIARSAGCSLSTVQNALEEAGIPATPRPEPLSLRITREELEHAYVHQRLSIPDIAEQFGLDRHRLNLLAKKWGIEIRPNSATSNPFALLPDAPALSPSMAAVSNVRNCVERLRRLVRLPGQRNLCAAARSLGTLPATLTHQLHALEKAAGVQLIERTSPLAATPAGAALIHEAEHLLSLLDAAQSSVT